MKRYSVVPLYYFILSPYPLMGDFSDMFFSSLLDEMQSVLLQLFRIKLDTSFQETARNFGMVINGGA